MSSYKGFLVSYTWKCTLKAFATDSNQYANRIYEVD